jgi:hypothetical protein
MRTTESQIVEKVTRSEVRKRAGSRGPFRVEVPTDLQCNLDSYLPNSNTSIDRDWGTWNKVYVVSPPPPHSPDGRWIRTQTGERVCKPQPISKEARGTRDATTNITRVSELAILPAPAIGISPASEGITGAPVRLWAAGIPDGWVALPAAALDGKRVEIEVRPTGFAWDAGDTGTAAPPSTYETPHAGSPSSPAVEHVYETKSSVGRPGEGVYTISVAVTWERRYRVVGVADPCNDWCDLGPGRTSASMPYRVAEVRAVLVP